MVTITFTEITWSQPLETYFLWGDLPPRPLMALAAGWLVKCPFFWGAQIFPTQNWWVYGCVRAHQKVRQPTHFDSMLPLRQNFPGTRVYVGDVDEYRLIFIFRLLSTVESSLVSTWYRKATMLGRVEGFRTVSARAITPIEFEWLKFERSSISSWQRPGTKAYLAWASLCTFKRSPQISFLSSKSRIYRHEPGILGSRRSLHFMPCCSSADIDTGRAHRCHQAVAQWR